MKKENKNIYKFFIKMLLIFISLDFIMMLVSGILASSSMFAKYGQDLICEMFYALAILIVMLLFHNSYVFTEKRTKFWESVCLGMPMLIISTIYFLANISSIKSFSIPNFLNTFILCAFIGIAEEFLCRGWLQNEFIERFSDDKKSVIKSIFLASLVFGAMHIINVFSQSLFETVLQIINAISLGMLLGSIYYKSKNIWSVIFLHAFYDFSIFLGEMNLIKDCTYGTPSMGVAIVNCISVLTISLFWIFSALKVLNKINNKNTKESKKKDSFYTAMIIIFFILLFVPFQNLVPDYDKYETCYEYSEIESLKNYEEHYPNYDKYYIDLKNKVSRFDEDAFSENLEEVTNEEQYMISFKLNDNKTVNIKNDNTTYEVRLDIKDVNNLELLENEDSYIVIIQSLENESTIYYNKINKADLRNSKDFIDFIANSFTKYSLPEISKVGYVTFENNRVKYPYFVSVNGDKFIIRNESLYLIK